MDSIFGRLLNALSEIWRNIGIAQKVSIVLIGMVTVGVTAVIIYFGSQPDWQVLYSDLDQKTASQIYDMVKDSGVQVKLTNSGSTIMVPSAEVYKMRLKVAGEGISVQRNGGSGWEIFDNQPLGLTDKQQQVALQRAIQGELQRMINEMPGILSSKVMLNLPSKKVFRREKLRPSASVMLVLEQSMRPSAQQVNSIRYLIASAVSGMKPQDVSIADNRGQLLVRQVTDEEEISGDSDKNIDVCRRIEQSLKEKAEAILSPIVGRENVVAMVSCDVDFNNIDRISENYDVEKTAVIMEKVVNQESSKEGANISGKAGVASNANTEVDVNNPAFNSGGNEKVSSENSRTAERRYVIPKVVEKVTINGARVKKLCVAVSVAKKSDGTSWKQEELDKFKSLVTAAVGAENYGKDNYKIEVSQMDFVKPPPAEVVTPQITDIIMFNVERITQSPLVRPVLGVTLLLSLYLIFRKYFKKTGGVEGAELAALGPAMDMNGIGGDNGVYREDVKQIESIEPPKERTEVDSLLDSIEARAEASPQKVASLMENWMAQDQ